MYKRQEEGKQLKVQFSKLLNPDSFQKLLFAETQIGAMVNKEIALHNQISSTTQLMIVTKMCIRDRYQIDKTEILVVDTEVYYRLCEEG